MALIAFLTPASLVSKYGLPRFLGMSVTVRSPPPPELPPADAVELLEPLPQPARARLAVSARAAVAANRLDFHFMTSPFVTRRRLPAPRRTARSFWFGPAERGAGPAAGSRSPRGRAGHR